MFRGRAGSGAIDWLPLRRCFGSRAPGRHRSPPGRLSPGAHTDRGRPGLHGGLRPSACRVQLSHQSREPGAVRRRLRRSAAPAPVARVGTARRRPAFSAAERRRESSQFKGRVASGGVKLMRLAWVSSTVLGEQRRVGGVRRRGGTGTEGTRDPGCVVVATGGRGGVRNAARMPLAVRV